MKLSARLQAIADMIKSGRVIDVGCDHAFLAIYLTKEKNCECIACDISSKVLEQTKKMMERYQVHIPIIQSDGLKEIDVKEDDFVVIAGMGASTILHILEDERPKHLIIQSNNDLFYLRQKITAKGFSIIKEQVVYEKGLYYVIMCYQKRKTHYSEQELFLGPILMQKKEESTMHYFEYLLTQKRNIIKQIPNDSNEKKKFLKEIQYLEKIISED